MLRKHHFKLYQCLNLSQMKILKILAFIAIYIFSSLTAQSQNVADSLPQPIIQPAVIPSAHHVPEILAIKILKVDASSGSPVKKSNQAYAGDIIAILINHPAEFLKLRPTDQSKLILFADGIQLDGIYSHRFEKLSNQTVASGQINFPDSLWIPFELTRNSQTQEAWKTLYRINNHWYDNEDIITADLGWEGMFPINQSNTSKAKTRISLVFYQPFIFWIWFVFYALFIVLFIYLCAKTNIIRESCGNNKGAFSLSQTQLVFWTVVVIGGFIYSVVLTDLTNSLNSSVLLLLGISIGTSGIANSIDYYKRQKNNVMALKPHRNFLFDILSDGDNISVQRAQILMWNIVFGIYFITFTIDNKTMPEFSDTLLVLSGVSSSFYLGGKITENSPDNTLVAEPLADSIPANTAQPNNPSAGA